MNDKYRSDATGDRYWSHRMRRQQQPPHWSHKQQILESQAIATGATTGATTNTGATNDHRYWSHEQQILESKQHQQE